MKEQVSGLVVERLHSRLAAHDGLLDALQNKLTQFDNVLEPVKEVASRVAELSKGQAVLSMQTRNLVAASHNTSDILSSMPELLSGATEPLRNMVADLISIGPTSGKAFPPSGDFLRFGSTAESQDKASEPLAPQRCEFSSHVPPRQHGRIQQCCAAREHL
jgi:ABC-type transporter Mla subunit MlaD